MNALAASELIVNERGAIYHINCRPEEIAPLIITVGDPDRVPVISKYFDEIYFKNSHREFVTHTGRIGNQKVSVLSTGIGPDNIDIVLNELDALANIDMVTRQIKPHPVSLKIVRMGTAGSLQKDIPVDSFVASTHGLGLDNLLNFYCLENNEEEKQILHAFQTHTQIHSAFTNPYISGAGVSLLKNFAKGYHAGITVTCPGFYGPQGRVLRMGLKHPHLISQLTSFRFGNHRIGNFEMETSAIYGMGKILGHQCLSLSVIVANRVSQDFSKNATVAIENLIKTSLEILISNP